MKIKSKKQHFRKQQVKLFRENDPLFSVFMWGVKHTIHEMEGMPMPEVLMPSDYKSHSKIKKENHNFNKMNMPSHFKFKEYCPLVFKKLRHLFGYSEQSYLSSLVSNTPITVVPSDSEGDDSSNEDDNDHEINNSSEDSNDGKNKKTKDKYKVEQTNSSSQYPTIAPLYYSHDKNLLVKFISGDDVANIHSFLPNYYRHIVLEGSKTLLPRFLAMYRMSHFSSADVNKDQKDSKGYYCIVTENMYPKNLKIHRQYDLKGSKVGRKASLKERKKGFLYDNDWENGGDKVYLDKDVRKKFLKTLANDANFLAQNKIISYSLLIGINDPQRSGDVQIIMSHKESVSSIQSDPPNIRHELRYVSEANPDLGQKDRYADASKDPDDSVSVHTVSTLTSTHPSSKYEYKSNTSDLTYFMGLIDVFTDYDSKTKVAHAMKHAKHGSSAEISTVKPEKYKTRFIDYISNHVLPEQ